jgi:hypothetical protein
MLEAIQAYVHVEQKATENVEQKATETQIAGPAWACWRLHKPIWAE